MDKTNIKIVDLKGTRIKKDHKDGDSDSSESTDSIEIDDSHVVEEPPAPMFSFYSMVRGLMRFSMNQFFRDITVLGKHNIPKKGPVIFCGNHNNQFCDGTILFSFAERDVRFIVAAKSMRRPVLKELFTWSKSIPVERAQDQAKSGKGTVQFDDAMNLLGEGTLFTKEVSVGDTIKFSTGEGQLKVEE